MTNPPNMSLTDLGKTLRRQFVMHMKLDKGRHLYEYAVVDPKGKRIGTISKHSQNGKVLSQIWSLHSEDRDKGHITAERFLTAYQKQLRDAEFDAAQPKDKA